MKHRPIAQPNKPTLCMGHMALWSRLSHERNNAHVPPSRQKEPPLGATYPLAKPIRLVHSSTASTREGEGEGRQGSAEPSSSDPSPHSASRVSARARRRYPYSSCPPLCLCFSMSQFWCGLVAPGAVCLQTSVRDVLAVVVFYFCVPADRSY